MSSEEKHPIRNSVIATVIGGLIVALLLWFVPGAWAWIKSALAWLYGLLVSTVIIPMWLLVVMILAILPTVLIIVLAVLPSSKQAEGPRWTDYTEDSFDGITWRWQYAGNSLINLWCFCPYDDTVLVYSFDEILGKISLHCETCQTKFGPFVGDKDYMLARIERQIGRKVRSGEWEKMVRPAT
jgi:hypothetical protein